MKEIHLNPYAFSEMDYLRFLIVNYTGNNNNMHGFEGLEFDFTELRCLYWDSYPFTSLPLKFYPQNLLVLKMRKNNLEQLWSGIKDLANIKYIDLSYSERLRKVPDLYKAQNLECLILEGCTSLLEISAPSQNLDKLVSLNLRDCKSLTNLPIGIQSKLRDVILSGCSNFNTALRISHNMEQLCLDGTAIKELSSSIESPSRLVELNLQDCSRLENLPSSICNLNSLRQLNLSGLSNLKFVLGIPRNIKELYLDGSAIKELSSSIEFASSLVRLSLKDCSSLESLPDSICGLKSLIYICISGCSKLDRLPKDIGNLDSLEVLEVTGNSKDCLRLESLPSSICNLNLQLLDLSGLIYLKMVAEFPWRIEELYLDGTAIKELSTSIENASSLVILSLKDCSSLESLPDGICRLRSLKYLCISGCSKLDRLPADIGDLESLEVLEADGITVRELPSSMGRLKNLHDLSFMGCKSQELQCSLSPILPGLFLRKLNLNHCGLTELPNNLGELNFLRELFLDGNNFESVPTSIINLSALMLLSISLCNRIQSLPKLQRQLVVVKADSCKLLKVLSGFEIQRYRYKHNFRNCFNLDWNAVRVIFNALLEAEKGNVGSGSMVFPGSEIPEWFDFQSNGSRIELPAPGDSFNRKFLGFVVCAIVGVPDYISVCSMCVGYSLILKFRNDSDTVEDAVYAVGDIIKSDHVVMGYDLWTSGSSKFKGCMKVIIDFYSPSYLIKKCGVRLLFSEEFGKGMKRSRCSITDEEEAHSKRLKSSNLFKGESSSSLDAERLGFHLVLPEEVEESSPTANEFNPSANESSSFSFDSNELPQDFVKSYIF